MKLILALILSLSVGLECTDSVGGGFLTCRTRWWCPFDLEMLLFSAVGSPHFVYTFRVSISKSGSFSSDLGCVLAILLPILYSNVLSSELKRLLPQFAEHCVCIGASVPNLLHVCVACLSQVVCVKLSGASLCVCVIPRVTGQVL